MAAGSATIRRETEEADGITRERDLGRGNSERRPVSPVLNSDVARKKVFHALCRAAGAIRCHRVVPGNKHDA